MPPLTPLHSLFGASHTDLIASLPAAGYADVASVRRTVAQGSTAQTIVVDSTVGLDPGDLVHVAIAGHDETREIDTIDSATAFTVTQAFSAVPLTGETVDNGPQVIQRELVRAESLVISKLPERYRRLIERVDGELIVRSAESGQTAATLGLPPAGTVKLYRNFTGMLEELPGAGELDAASWSRDGQAITFDPPLAEGDRILASYGVAIETITILQTILLDLATYRVGRMLFGQLQAVTPEWLLSFRERGEQVLDEIFTSGRGIAELDSLSLYEDWQRPNRGIISGIVERS
ncbi:MAG TPA: hypothetical protein VM223_05205 [Planctomycetota bacterium]|nr:hypothetical protein [Planctomycetota bacterium]